MFEKAVLLDMLFTIIMCTIVVGLFRNLYYGHTVKNYAKPKTEAVEDVDDPLLVK